MSYPAFVQHKNFKRSPGWYWYFGQNGDAPEDTGKCGPYKSASGASRSAKMNGFRPTRDPRFFVKLGGRLPSGVKR